MLYHVIIRLRKTQNHYMPIPRVADEICVCVCKSLKKLKHGHVFGYRMMGGMEWNKIKLA